VAGGALHANRAAARCRRTSLPVGECLIASVTKVGEHIPEALPIRQLVRQVQVNRAANVGILYSSRADSWSGTHHVQGVER